MEITNQTNNTSAIGKTENGTLVYDSATKTDTNLFLELLVAQMTNQDPSNTQDTSQYVTQLAQFNTLEQMISLNDSMENLTNINNTMLVNNSVESAASLIGKNIEASVQNEAGNYDDYSGTVKSASIKNSTVYLEIELNDTGEMKEVQYSSITKINENKEL